MQVCVLKVIQEAVMMGLVFKSSVPTVLASVCIYLWRRLVEEEQVVVLILDVMVLHAELEKVQRGIKDCNKIAQRNNDVITRGFFAAGP